jgi:hypothetical protein
MAGITSGCSLSQQEPASCLADFATTRVATLQDLLTRVKQQDINFGPTLNVINYATYVRSFILLIFHFDYQISTIRDAIIFWKPVSPTKT